MRQLRLLLLTGVLEVGTGLGLLVLPAVPIKLLFGLDRVSVEAFLIARLLGAALVAISVTSYLASRNPPDVSQSGVLTGILIYDVAAAALLAYAGCAFGMTGIALWPAVAIHSALGVWCAACLVK